MTDEDLSQEDQAIDKLFEGEDESEDSETDAESEVDESEQEDDTKGDTDGEPDDDSDGDTSDESEPPSDKEQKLVPIAALLDERRKAQLLKEENEKLKSQFQQEEDETAPDPLDDPEGYKQYLKNQANRELYQERAEESRSRMLESHSDYEEMEKIFMFLASQDSALVTQMNKHPDPAKFAYDKASEYKAEQRESIKNEFRESLKAEILAELKAGAQPPEESEADKRKRSAVSVPNLTKATATDTNSTTIEKDEDLDDMFEDQKY